MTLNRSRPRSPRYSRRSWGAVLLAFTLHSCGLGDVPDALGYWRRLRHDSLETTRHFLDAAARGDSAGLVPLATDSVIAEVLLLHRNGASQDLQAAAEGFQPTGVTVYGWGAEVRFEYALESRRNTGAVILKYDADALRVSRFGAPVTID